MKQWSVAQRYKWCRDLWRLFTDAGDTVKIRIKPPVIWSWSMFRKPLQTVRNPTMYGLIIIFIDVDFSYLNFIVIYIYIYLNYLDVRCTQLEQLTPIFYSNNTISFVYFESTRITTIFLSNPATSAYMNCLVKWSFFDQLTRKPSAEKKNVLWHQ